jgi:hypothetical protein
MIRIVSHGDRIRSGTYRVHSRFRRAVNFVSGFDLLCCVDRSVGAGPLNFVFEDAVPGSIDSIRIGSDGCWVNGTPVTLGDAERYASGLAGRYAGGIAGDELLGAAAVAVQSAAPDADSVFLLGGDLPAGGDGFTGAVRQRLAGGWSLIDSGNYGAGAAALKGVGRGLTPAGDDLLCGIMTALNLRRLSGTAGEAPDTGVLLSAAIGDNPFSNAFLGCAADGFLPEKFHRFTGVLMQGPVNLIPPAVEDLLDVGHTSGIDFAVGCILGLRKYRK